MQSENVMQAKTANLPAPWSALEVRWPLTVWMSRMFMVPPTLSVKTVGEAFSFS
jgi:hypothetical protein